MESPPDAPGVGPSAELSEPAFPIVGIGASAGGLDAFKQLLQALPADTGAAFVLVQHLAPTHVSMLADILARSTTMPVVEVKDEPRVTPNCVYVIPPNRTMVMIDGHLRLLPREEGRGQHRPVDAFLRSLAEQDSHQAVGVILSGTGTDGTFGLAAIKAEGGITFAQDGTAQQDGMPKSAIAAGCVDFILPPDEIAAELARIGRHPYVTPDPPGPLAAAGNEPLPSAAVGNVLQLLHKTTGVDFRNYRSTTLYRRITRRMLLHKLDGLDEYLRLLRSDAAEVQSLYRDILISVTAFFRDPQSIDALKTTVFPALLKGRTRNEPVRVWVLGCSTGEEAYSIAIAIAECVADRGTQVPAQIFATDLNEHGIAKARAGLYAKNIVQDVSPERLARFFVETDAGYQVVKSVRDACVFARQNVLSDPPFSRMDLITCRNLLIYMEPVLQRQILPLFHYALKPNGYLWLGSSETVGTFTDLFGVNDSRHKIFHKKGAQTQLHLTTPLTTPVWPSRAGRVEPPPGERRGATADAQKEADRFALAKYSPPGVLVNSDLEVLQFRGDTGPYLTQPPGKPSLNLLKMTREGLTMGLRTLVQKVLEDGTTGRHEGLRVKSDGATREVNLQVVPLRGEGAAGCFLVLFEPVGGPTRDVSAITPAAPEAADAEREIARLVHELSATREYMQSLGEQQEASNEELQSANEEIQSANEELQSINEELQTSKEEIQSSNEELTTVNEEMIHRNEQLGRANGDLINFLSSTHLALVTLGPDLCVRRFTPQAEKMLNLTTAAVGRPIGDLDLPIDYPELARELAVVINTARIVEQEVRDRNGRWFSMRLRPYRTPDNHIDGAVLVFVDITVQKRAEDALREADRRKDEFLAMLAHELRNPLAPLMSSVELLRLAAGGEGTERVRAVMGRQLDKLKRLVDDLLDVSRVNQGKIELKSEPMDLVGTVSAAVEAVQLQVDAQAQTLSVVVPPGTLSVQGDPTRLEQVVTNLLGNAVKYTDVGGRIEVVLERRERQAILRVRDSGIGIAPELLPRVFDLFTQADTSSARSRGGLGIGLSLVRQLVQLHGGSVEANSAGLGRGSEFVVRLPLLPELPGLTQVPERVHTVVAPSPTLGGILVVDDNVDAAESLALLLRLSGHEVRVAHAGLAAIAIAAEFQPQAVILDIGMPGMDGYAVARALRTHVGGQERILVTLSGYGQEEDRQRSREAGCNGHLVKPVNLPDLEKLLASLAK
ncbi:chemotaxis protein CheB [Fimbriiglobus ruber]|uniref:Chemotaxis protein methyltransferase CheR n=1 Tax=Fimbriiglobus ruber TaxID=1908690 RepID=A0A225DPW9_9BACT|nr:chemotaxis protein CheB [Fimbriiglobus ruber]OWK43133.1 Chemotaxis protein methyltransferase CheR [Fimbriiglobus ruber]